MDVKTSREFREVGVENFTELLAKAKKARSFSYNGTVYINAENNQASQHVPLMVFRNVQVVPPAPSVRSVFVSLYDAAVYKKVQRTTIFSDGGDPETLELSNAFDSNSREMRPEQKLLLNEVVYALKHKRTPPSLFKADVSSGVFLPLVRARLDDPADSDIHPVLGAEWIRIAKDVEALILEKFRDTNLVHSSNFPSDFRLWSDVIEEHKFSPIEVGEGFGKQNPEGILKSVLSSTPEHAELGNSMSLNYFPLLPDTISPTYTPTAFWRAWFFEDMVSAAKLYDSTQEDKEKLNWCSRRDIHLYCEKAFGGFRELFSNWVVNVLKAKTYFVDQYPGDVILTASLSSHDVVYVGPPSYQVHCFYLFLFVIYLAKLSK